MRERKRFTPEGESIVLILEHQRMVTDGVSVAQRVARGIAVEGALFESITILFL
jgi:hypothetical protein